VELGAREQPESLFQFFKILTAQSATLEPHPVCPQQFHRTWRTGLRIRQDVLVHYRVTAQKTVGADPAKLMNTAVSTHHGIVLNIYVPGQRRSVSHDHVVANVAVVCDVNIGHQQIMTADAGYTPAAFGTAMHGDKLAEDVGVPDFQACGLPVIFQVLWLETN